MKKSKKQKTAHSNAIKLAWKLGRYKNRDESYRTKDFNKEVSDTLKKSWKNGLYTKERNLKISKTHKKNHKLQKRITLICKTCFKEFLVRPCCKHRTYCSLKCFHKNPEVLKLMSSSRKGRKVSKATRLKISKSTKGKLPKNWTQIIGRRNKFWQKKLYKLVKKYFPKCKYEYKVQINKKRRRFLDVAIVDKMIDIEYDGMIHLSRKVQINDKKREKELIKSGWKIIRFNKNNYHLAEEIIKGL
jgi:very-short-patch-repair endonuclease